MNMIKKVKEINNKMLGKRMGISPFFSTVSGESCKSNTPFLYKNGAVVNATFDGHGNITAMTVTPL